jgi:excisionase family DNA binding protein
MATPEEGRKINHGKRGRPAKTPRQILGDEGDLTLAASVKKSARRVGLGTTTMYRLIGEGKIRSFCVGSRRLIATEELLRFVREQAGA